MYGMQTSQPVHSAGQSAHAEHPCPLLCEEIACAGQIRRGNVIGRLPCWLRWGLAGELRTGCTWYFWPTQSTGGFLCSRWEVSHLAEREAGREAPIGRGRATATGEWPSRGVAEGYGRNGERPVLTDYDDSNEIEGAEAHHALLMEIV
ncbi:hypothetical protein CIHG_09223 [Coccidioides immitis H538.4]|uniref:Uncharacterized protein n=1 Tax=Coccidioides immitis H538.4 TaxID=396776 RepID=A0A0J8S3C9_COCIT|nr:hypothetical protein CIHG_09223 [Coccidioides immitis H538.4]